MVPVETPGTDLLSQGIGLPDAFSPPRGHTDGAVLRGFPSRGYLSVMKFLLANWIIFR